MAARDESFGLDRSEHIAVGRRRIQRRTLVSLSLLGASLAAIAIAIGLPVMGLGVYLATTLPLVFFS
jgi:hypothetical protein